MTNLVVHLPFFGALPGRFPALSSIKVTSLQLLETDGAIQSLWLKVPACPGRIEFFDRYNLQMVWASV